MNWLSYKNDNLVVSSDEKDVGEILEITQYPTWNYIREIVIKTRNYDKALTAVRLFIQIVENAKDQWFL